MITLAIALAIVGPAPPYPADFRKLIPDMATDVVDRMHAGAWRWCTRPAATLEPERCVLMQDAAIMDIASQRRQLSSPHADRAYLNKLASDCDALYADHGSEDVRILQRCLLAAVMLAYTGDREAAKAGKPIR
jgi:hypothetical protein